MDHVTCFRGFLETFELMVVFQSFIGTCQMTVSMPLVVRWPFLLFSNTDSRKKIDVLFMTCLSSKR